MRGPTHECPCPHAAAARRLGTRTHNTHLIIHARTHAQVPLPPPHRSKAPGYEESTLAAQLRLADYAFTGFFTLEAMLKIGAWGFLFAPSTYLRSGGCSSQVPVPVVVMLQPLLGVELALLCPLPWEWAWRAAVGRSWTVPLNARSAPCTNLPHCKLPP